MNFKITGVALAVILLSIIWSGMALCADIQIPDKSVCAGLFLKTPEPERVKRYTVPLFDDVASGEFLDMFLSGQFKSVIVEERNSVGGPERGYLKNIAPPEHLYRIVSGEIEYTNDGFLMGNALLPKAKETNYTLPMNTIQDVDVVNNYLATRSNFNKDTPMYLLEIDSAKVLVLKASSHLYLQDPEYFGAITKRAIISVKKIQPILTKWESFF